MATSFYGLETISPSPGSTETETSPTATPRSSAKQVSIDAVTSQLQASAAASADKVVQCCTHDSRNARSERDSSASGPAAEVSSTYWAGPELHLDEVRA